MSNTFTGKGLGQDVVARMGHRPRHRRRRARRDPARRSPRSLPRPRRWRERPDAGARREAAHPDRDAGPRSSRRTGCTRATTLPAQGSRGRRDRGSGSTWPDARQRSTSSRASRSRRPTSRPATPPPVDSQITGTQRAFSISIDNVHGVAVAGAGRRLGRHLHLRRGRREALRSPNVKVLTIPAVPGPSGGSNLVLRIETGDASKWRYAADNTQFYLRAPPGHRR